VAETEGDFPGLLERGGVLDAATRVLDAARSGHGGTLLVLAEAGLGKTSVLDAACRNAKDDFSIGLARGDAMETTLPFGLLSQALSALGGGDILDGHGSGHGRGSSGPDGRAARFYAVLRWLEESAPRPALLALDDLHWADADSLALLSFVCRRAAGLPVAIIGTLRPWPTSARLAAEALAHDGYASIDRLEPLTSDGAAALLAEHAHSRLDEAQVQRASEICAGNPLLLEQVAMAVARGEEIPRASAGEVRRLHDWLLLGRFAGLPAAGMACARAGAVFGERFRPDLAVDLAELDRRGGDEALDALERSGLVRPSQPGKVEFVHPLFRQAVYDDLGGSVRVRYHARAFALLAGRGLEEEAAEHAVKADLAGDPAAIATLERVGRAARRKGATQSAASVLEAAATLAGDRANPDLLCDLAEAMSAAGRPAEAAGVMKRALRQPDVPAMIRARSLRALARAHAYLGEYQAAARLVDESVDLAEPVDAEFAATTLLAYSRIAQFTAGPAAACTVLDRAKVIARSCDPPLRWAADAGWAVMALSAGDASGLAAAEAAARAAEADSATAARRSQLVGGGALSSYAAMAKYVGRLAESEHYFRVRIRICRQIGNVEEEVAALAGYGGTLQRRLRLDEAKALADRCAGLSDLLPLAGAFAAVDRANVLLLMGRLDDSEESASRADTVVTAMRAWQQYLFLAYGRAWRCLAEGRLAEACEHYGRIEAISARVGLREPCEVPWARHGIAAYVGFGRRADAERVLGWLDDCSAGLPCRWPHIASAHGRALLAEADGDQDLADALFQQAMTLHEDLDWPLEWLQTLLEYGKFLRRAGQPVRARRLLAQAAELAEETGALWLAGQARDELRVAGGRRREKEDPGRLTAQEERVAALAASGASNAEIAAALFVSVNTVETHLRHVYGKLGIRSRRRLSSALAGRTSR
jgi:ATP/maltotriose-dependent transcriptional regulator MalT